MYTRTVTQKNKDGTVRKYLQIVHSYRENGKVKQRVLALPGRLGSDLTPMMMDQLMKSLANFSKTMDVVDSVRDVTSVSSLAYGEKLVCRRAWEALGLGKLLKECYRQSGERMRSELKATEVSEALFMAVANRLMDPRSKRGTSRWKESVYAPEWAAIGLMDIYRAMDWLQAHKATLERGLFENAKKAFGSEVNVVMFDTTTLGYWGRGDAEIFQYTGRPKDKRKDLKHIIVGLIMDRSGAPLGHEVWKGTMSDVESFRKVIASIKETYRIGKVILVADRGMISGKTLTLLESKDIGYEYILAVKMRQLSEVRRRVLLSSEGFRPTGVGPRFGKEKREWELWKIEELEARDRKQQAGKTVAPWDEANEAEVKESPKGQRRWVVCLNEERAKEDAAKRERFYAIVEKNILTKGDSEWLIKNGFSRFVRVKGLEIELDYEKLRAEEFYDGKWVLVTNTDLPVAQLVRAYKDLARIEQHFRTLKSELEMGPIYHWKERRVRAHIFICFLALQVRTFVRQKLREFNPKISYSEAVDALADLRATTFTFKSKSVVQRTEPKPLAIDLFRAVRAKIPNKILALHPLKT